MGWRRRGAAVGWQSRGVWWLPRARAGLQGWGDGGRTLTSSLLLFCKCSRGRAMTPLAGRGRWQRNPRVLRSSHTLAAPAHVYSAPEPGEPASTLAPGPAGLHAPPCSPNPASHIWHPAPQTQHRGPSVPHGARLQPAPLPQGLALGEELPAVELQTCRRGGFPGMKLMLSNPSTALCRQGWLQSSRTQLLNPWRRPNARMGFGARQARWAVQAPRGSEVSVLQPAGLLGVSLPF